MKQHPHSVSQKYLGRKLIIDSLHQYSNADIPPDHRSDLNEEIKLALKSWTTDSTPINTALRYGEDYEYFIKNPDAYKKAILEANLLSEAINLSALNQGYIVTRGLGPYDVARVKAAIDERNKTGISPIIIDKGFTAVSFDGRIALKYADPDKLGEIFIITSKLKTGDKALFIGNESTLTTRREGEILLMSETKYFISDERIFTSESGMVVHLIDVVFLKDE